MSAESEAVLGGVPRTAAELTELEDSYRPFAAATEWHGVRVDQPRWDRFAHRVARRRTAAGEQGWAETADRLLRTAALDSAALDGLFPANPELTALVAAGSIAARAADDDPAGVLVECSRRALVLASEAAASGRAVDQQLIAVLQDVITEAQASYTVSTDLGEIVEVDLPRRQYKPVSNYLPLAGGGIAAFAPARLVAAEMERLAGELGSPHFAALHPVVQAAYAHYALTAIHPFADGNGRLARVIASVFLMRAVGVPLIVFAEQWPAYYQALYLATQDGDAQALADFTCATSMSAMDLAANLLARPARGALAAEVLGLPTAGRDGTGTLDEAACALLQTVAIELREALVAPRRGIRLALTTSRTLPAGHAEGAYRLAAGQAVVRLALRVTGNSGRDAAASGADLEFVALVSTRDGDLLPAAVRETRTGELLEVAFGDAYPLVNEAVMVRARLWVQRLAAAALTGIAR